MTYYLVPYLVHPWEDNNQLCLDFTSEQQAHQTAGILSSIYGAPVRVSTKSGYRSVCDYIYAESKLDGKIKTIKYRVIEM